MTPHVEDRDRADLETCLREIEEALTQVLEARSVHSVNEATCSAVASRSSTPSTGCCAELEEIGRFVIPLSHGELSAQLPSPDNRMAAPLVEMHARLRQLTRQTQEIARGDYAQRIDFMGEFSEAFNAMIVLLEERERTLTDEIARRRQAEDELQRERDLLVAGPVVTFRWGVTTTAPCSTFPPTSARTGTRRRSSPAAGATTPASWTLRISAGCNEDGNDKSKSGLDSWTQEYRIIDAEGETHWVRDFTHTVRGADGAATAYEGYIIDITAQKAAETALRQREEQLRMLSLSDGLTGLYNRRGLLALGDHTMRSARRRARGLGVICVDIEGLKAINDRFGHAQGDEALCAVADVIRASIRESDVAGRVGGDEFIVLAEDDPAVTLELAARLRRRMDHADEASGRPFRLSLGIGVADWEPGEQVTLQELIERAGQRLHDDRREIRR